MTQVLGLAAIDAVRIPPVSEKPRFTQDELRAIFPDSFGPLVERFPNWPGLWHRGQSPVAAFIRAAETCRLTGKGTQLAKMAEHLPSGGFIQPAKVPALRQRGERIEFPEWVR